MWKRNRKDFSVPTNFNTCWGMQLENKWKNDSFTLLISSRKQHCVQMFFQSIIFYATLHSQDEKQQLSNLPKLKVCLNTFSGAFHLTTWSTLADGIFI